MIRFTLISIVLIVLSGTGHSSETDSFALIKQMLSSAKCVRFEFLSILHSDVFQSSDTLAGTAVLGDDGRYLVRIGPDAYRNDLNEIWSYSEENNQLVIEPALTGSDQTDQFVFITRLDELYESSIQSLSSG